MREETNSPPGGNAVEKLGQSQDHIRQLQRDRSQRSKAQKPFHMTGSPEAISPCEDWPLASPRQREAKSSAGVAKDPKIVQKVAEPPPVSVTQMKQPSVQMSHPYTGSADNQISPIPHRDGSYEALPRWSHRHITNNFSPPFEPFDIGGKEDKDKKWAVGIKAGRILRKRSSSCGERLSQYFEFYRFEKRGEDWTVADRIPVKAPQEELKYQVMKNKSKCTILDKMTAMNALRREQIHQLLDEKNEADKDIDAEWVPVLLQTIRQRGNSVLAFDVIIAQSSTPRKRVLLVSEKSNVRVPIKSKDPTADRGTLYKSHGQNTFDDKIVFTKFGRPIVNGRLITDARPLDIKKQRPDLYADQRLFSSDGTPMSDGRFPDDEGQNFDHSRGATHFTKDYKPKIDGRPIITLLRNDRSSTSVSNGPITCDKKLTDIDNNSIDIMLQTLETRHSVPEFPALGSISEPWPRRPQMTSQADMRNDLYLFHGNSYPRTVAALDHVDVRGPFDVSSTVQRSGADSAYYSASDIMSSRCESVSPVTFRTHEPLSPLQPGCVIHEDRPTNPMNTPHRNYVDLEGLRRPSASASPISRKKQKFLHPFSCNSCHKRFPRAIKQHYHLLTHNEEQPFICTICNQVFTHHHDRTQHEELHNGDRLVSDSASIQNPKHNIDKGYGAEGGASVAEPKPEGAMVVPYVDLAAGNEVGHNFKKVEADNAETALSTPAPPVAPVLSVQTGLQLRPKPGQDSLFLHPSPKRGTDYNIAMSEAITIPNEHTQDLVYYCSVGGCRFSANPDFRDLDPRIAKKIHDSESHKVYLLKGLPQTDLEVHMWEAHDIASKDLESKSLVTPSTYRHIPAIAEERRFEVASETFPSACGWLMRTRIADGAWRDWMGMDYDIVAASGFTPWANRPGLDEFQPSNATGLVIAMTNENGGAMVKSGDITDVAAEEIEGELNLLAGEVPVRAATDKEVHIIQPTETRSFNEGLISTGKENLLKAAMIPQFVDRQQTVSPPSTSINADCDPMSQPASVHTPDKRETPSHGVASNDNDLSSDVSIRGYTKRHILGSVMNEFRTSFFTRSPKKFSCPSDGSESNSSSDVTKTSSSAGQAVGDFSSIRAGKKRSQDREPISEDDDGNQKRHKKSSVTSQATGQCRRLACPFNKHDPKIYAPSNEAHEMAHKFRACGGPGWPTVARLKEHLYRVHPSPIQCARCWLTVKTEKELEAHVRAQVPCPVQPQPQIIQWLPRDKIEVLKERKKSLSALNEEERWKYVYGILFPEDLSLPSPYYDDLEQRRQDDRPESPSSRDFAAFEQYSQENLPRRVHEQVVSLLEERVAPIEESIKRLLPELVRSCQAQIFRDSARLKSGSNSEIAPTTMSESSEKESGTNREAYSGRPSLAGSTIWDDSISSFYVEPASTPIENAFDNTLPLYGSGEGSSSMREDPGYDANASECPEREQAGHGVADSEVSADFWNEFFSNPHQCSVFNGFGETCKYCGNAGQDDVD